MKTLVRWIMMLAAAMAGAAVVAADAAPAPATATATSPEYYAEQDLPASMKPPFSEAVRVGKMLYVSGTVGVDKTGKLVTGGIEAEAKQAMDNIATTLKRHGSSFEQVVQCTVVLADIKDWPAFNDVYRKYFTTHFPARMAFAAAGLALGARVEVQCNAALD